MIEKELKSLQPDLQIDEARVHLERSLTDSPPFSVSFHLVTPGPDVIVKATDHTLRAAVLKAFERMRERSATARPNAPTPDEEPHHRVAPALRHHRSIPDTGGGANRYPPPSPPSSRLSLMTDNLWLWIGFNAFVLIMLALDLGVFHRKAHVVTLKESLTWTAVWVVMAMIFNFGIAHYMGNEKALEFFTGYVIEKSLSVDNVFVFALLFSYFAVPPIYQHKVLFWGILGALVMRAVMIALGAKLITEFAWVIYIFGAFLILTGIKMIVKRRRKSTRSATRWCGCSSASCPSPANIAATSSSSGKTAFAWPPRCLWC